MFNLEILKKYSGFIGNTQESIEAIQKFIEKDKVKNSVFDEDIEPAASINKIIQAASCEETNNEIQKIIDNL